MDKDAHYEYGKIQEGSYFGDISILLNEPSEYAYAFNPYQEKPVYCLAIDSQIFLQICRQYPISYQVMLENAYRRKMMFQNYKVTLLISYMKTIVKNPKIITRKIANEFRFMERLKVIKGFESTFDLYKLLIQQYELNRLYKKI